VRVAALADVIRSKEAAGRDKDFAALPELYHLAGTSRTGPTSFPHPVPEAGRQPGPQTAAEGINAAREAARRRRPERGGRET